MKTLMIALIIALAMLASSYMPKPDYSHVPQEQRALVDFALSAGY